ncbi:hypothetical protein [Maribacter hydrothermalis]|uniref:BNR repeat-like domain-containing protein n=1 Tax=Maribacter hydrothermalis TaxID=1836467 RepID=A0A1B7Z8A4_9FLAO|nr:hypothetical protein [Maribacter hydrothermalis]APQ19065.1 hypothetical protein BTR34_17830 [Maribacter hydrothermalis]OBR38923.1 hypothetical protein A9200_04455 [Maribacter hydrothermalis]
MQLPFKICLPFLVLTLLVGCKEEAKKQPQKEEVSVIEELNSPAQSSSSLPHLMANKDVTLLSWVETVGDTIATFKYAELIEGQWQPAQVILNGTDWFINWADYPMISENNGNLWSHVLKKSTKGTYSYDIKMNVKPKGASAWQTNLVLHTDGTPTEHGFVSVQPYNDAFFVNWLDGRNTEEYEVGERGAMTLRAGIVSANGKMLKEYELDVKTCDCCQTTSAITDNGPVVIYRDRSDEEIRDIYIVRQVNGEWTTPKAIHEDNWQIKGCPVNGPKVAVLGNNLAVAWFTGAENKQKVQLAFSTDGGDVFKEPILIAKGTIMGRVDVLWVDEDSAVVSWMEADDKIAVFKAMMVFTDGTISQKQVITTMSDSRKSGFPQMEIVEETLYFAWTEEIKTVTKVRTAKMSVEDFSFN